MSGAGLAATIAASFLLGHELARHYWKDALPWGERALVSTLTGWAVWLASTWTLALLHLLTRPFLIARTVVFASVALALLLARVRRIERRDVNIRAAALIAMIVVVLPLIVWVDFSLWRGAVTPPASFDAVSYHLPKAVLFARAEGYDALRDVRFLIAWRPSNYELLLADAIAMDGVDDATEWISTFFYLSFIVASVALAQRWGGTGLVPSLTAALLAGGVPVALLHATDYKNDLMTAFFAVAALVLLGRWMSEREPRALVLAIVAITCAAGTKTPAAIFAALAVPLLVLRAPLLRVVAAVTLAFFLLGGVAWITRLTDRFATAVESPDTTTYSALTYGHFANLWKAPYVLVTQSFSPDPMSIRVPWSPKPWLWHRYELYYSELGIPCSLCALALPLCVWRFRTREKLAMTALAFLPFAAILPFDAMPVGRYLIGLPRLALPIVPVVFAWTAVPLAAWLERRRRGFAILIAASGLFAWYAAQNAIHDTFAPLPYVIQAGQRPTRLPPIGHRRAPAVLDEMAGPADRVAYDGGVSSLLHFAYGAKLTRPVTLIPPGEFRIADDVQWVVIDRAWSLVWGHEEMRDLSQGSFIRRGRPTDHDLRVITAMAEDPRFQAAYFDPRSMQAVFRRVR